jgi:threonine dehydratase
MKLYDAIYPRSVTEFSYRFGDEENALIFMSFEVTEREKELEKIFNQLRDQNMMGFDHTHDELAKSHIRYLVGGRQQVRKLNVKGSITAHSSVTMD